MVIRQLGNHCNIALDIEMLMLLCPLSDFSSLNTGINTRNLPSADTKMCTGILITHEGPNHLINVVMVMFLCSRLCYND